MRMSRQEVGSWGEDLAATYLTERGYTILERNVRTSYGEIDLVAQKEIGGREGEGGIDEESVLVFVEVKTRRSTKYGLPEEAMTSRKQAHLLAAIQSYLQSHPELAGSWRVDVIAILHSKNIPVPEIIHFENAITAA